MKIENADDNGSLPFLPELNRYRPHKGHGNAYAWYDEDEADKRISLVDKAIEEVKKLV